MSILAVEHTTKVTYLWQYQHSDGEWNNSACAYSEGSEAFRDAVFNDIIEKTRFPERYRKIKITTVTYETVEIDK